MAQKRVRSECGNVDKPKRPRIVLSLMEKVKILDMIEKEHKSFAEVAKKYNKNESSIREIYKHKKNIRESIATAPVSAKVTATVRNKVLVKTETALNVWIEDMTKRRVPIDGNVLQQKALSLYEEFSEEPNTSFIASRGWLNRFKHRFNLKNIKITGEAASADEEAAATFPAKFKEIIEMGGYDPRQVFNCDETGLLWKKMPGRTYIHRSAKRAPGFKAWKDRLTVVLCGNVAGHMIKPGITYRSKTPRALKNKNKNNLPVYWQHNRKAWVTAILFTQWFHECFIPEAKSYLEKERLSFKVLLLIDNAPGHPHSITLEDPNVQVVFLPPNTTALLQPLDQGIIRCVKATYTRQVFDMIRAGIDAEPGLNVMDCWKSFTIADAIIFIRGAVDELKPKMVKACWKNLWSEAVNDFEDFPSINNEVQRIIQLARQLGGAGMEDMVHDDVVDHIEESHEELTTEELEELIASSSEEEEEESEIEAEPAKWTLEKMREVFHMIQNVKEKIIDYDPSMERSIKVTRSITEAMIPLQLVYDELKRQRKQLPITMFFQKQGKEKVATTNDPQPSTSSAPVVHQSPLSSDPDVVSDFSPEYE